MKHKKTYPCIPSAKLFAALSVLMGFVAVGIILFLMNVPIAHWDTTPHSEKVLVVAVFGTAAAIEFGYAAWGVGRSLRRVTIRRDRIVCTAPFCKDIVIKYEDCRVGMDYSRTNGGKMWWIYLCRGDYADYKKRFKRINSVKYQDGFIRIAYEPEVFEALIEALPKKKAAALESFRRNLE